MNEKWSIKEKMIFKEEDSIFSIESLNEKVFRFLTAHRFAVSVQQHNLNCMRPCGFLCVIVDT
ncbi:MAG: hypothetical protein MUO78_04170, partial [candidate division Zixibacteria bacterium]|nr:hypothetical protein [candidate division Zixibacteria bacterium]